MWNKERTELCVGLWNEGLSASEVARRMACGFTRNAIIGKIHRLGLSNTVTQRKPKFRKKETNPRKTRKRHDFNASLFVKQIPTIYQSPLPPEPMKPDKLFSLTEIADREEQEHVKLCRFIYGDPKQEGSGYCGCMAATGSCYCPGHHHMIFTAPPVRVRTKPTCGPKIAVKNIGNPHHTRKMEVVW